MKFGRIEIETKVIDNKRIKAEIELGHRRGLSNEGVMKSNSITWILEKSIGVERSPRHKMADTGSLSASSERAAAANTMYQSCAGTRAD